MNKITNEQVVKDIEEYKENKERFVLRDVVLDYVLEALENQKTLKEELEKIKEAFCDMRDGYPRITDETLTVREVVEVINKRIKELNNADTD